MNSAHYTFDNTSSNQWGDEAGNLILTGKGTSSPTQTGGYIGSAVNLVRTSSQALVRLTDTDARFSVSGSFSIAAWIKLSSLPAAQIYPIASNWINLSGTSTRNYNFGIWNVGQGVAAYLRVYSSSTIYDFTAPLLIDLSGWHHLAVTYDSSNGIATIYLDGMLLRQTSSAARGLSAPSGPNIYFNIGSDQDNTFGLVNFFDGAIDELYFYNGLILTQAQVSQLAQQNVLRVLTSDPVDLLVQYYQYDSDNNQTIRTNGAVVAYYQYDPLNRIVIDQDNLLNSVYFGYDANSNLIQLRNRRRFATYFGYDGLNHETTIQDAILRVTYFGFDAEDNLTAVKYPSGNAIYFAYDGVRRLINYTDEVLCTTYFGYDIVGNRIVSLDQRENAVYFAYDVLDRQVASLDALGQTVYFAYDSLGKLTKVVNHILQGSVATTYYSYNALSRPTAVLDALQRVKYFEYSPIGAPTKYRFPVFLCRLLILATIN